MCTGEVPGCVEAVGAREARLVEGEALRLAVHPPDEDGPLSSRGGVGKRVGGVVRALDKRSEHEVANGDALSRAEIGRRLTDRRRLL